MQQTIWVCPRCQQRFIRSPHTGDFEHNCFGQEVLRNESILKIGDWEDYTGSDANVNQALMQGRENTLQGTRSSLEGAKEQKRDSRGFPLGRFRSRQHIEHFNDEFFNTGNIKSPRNPEEFEEKI